MNFLLDTNVVSEWTKPRPNPGLVAWLDQVDEDRVLLSVVTLAELRFGVERMASGASLERLQVWLGDQLPRRFEGRILTVDLETADIWGRLMAGAATAGRTLGAMDGLLAATAARHELTLVTRNTAHFETLGTALLNPWGEE